jgi:hypothetical protein
MTLICSFKAAGKKFKKAIIISQQIYTTTFLGYLDTLYKANGKGAKCELL